MEKLKPALKMLLFPPPLLTGLFAVLGYGAVLAVAVFKVQNPVLQYTSYIASAYALIITITGFPRFLAFARDVRRRALGHPLAQRLRSTPPSASAFSATRASARGCPCTGAFS